MAPNAYLCLVRVVDSNVKNIVLTMFKNWYLQQNLSMFQENLNKILQHTFFFFPCYPHKNSGSWSVWFGYSVSFFFSLFLVQFTEYCTKIQLRSAMRAPMTMHIRLCVEFHTANHCTGLLVQKCGHSCKQLYKR